jgi:hypothetical protein
MPPHRANALSGTKKSNQLQGSEGRYPGAGHSGAKQVTFAGRIGYGPDVGQSQGVRSVYEYKVVAAPTRGEKARGVKTGVDRFAHALQVLMNTLGRDGWDYVRADTLPCEERTGFTGRTTVYHNVLVFRRALASVTDAATPGTSAETAAPPRLTAAGPFGEAPPVRLGDVGPAPRLGPATGIDRELAAE